MICMEDIGHILPSHTSGKIVGIASHRGEYIIVACEHGLYKLWDDGVQEHAYRIGDSAPSASSSREG